MRGQFPFYVLNLDIPFDNLQMMENGSWETVQGTPLEGTVKKIIEEHGGKIWATSRENTGTTMYFVLRKYQEVPIHE